MRFKDVQCEYCKNIFREDDDVVVCPQCGSPHHRTCWNEKGSCANEERHEDGFEWKLPEHLKTVPAAKPRVIAPAKADYTFKNGESAVTCPHCGALNYGFDALCMQCKKPLYSDGKDYTPEEDGRENAAPLTGEALYEFFRKYGGLRPETEVNGHTAADNAEYIGKNSGKFIRKFAIIERFNRKFSVSIWAFILGPIWFFYRKLFKEGLLFLLAMLVLSSAGTYCSLTEPMKVYLRSSAQVVREFYEESEEAQEISDEKFLQAQGKIDGFYETYQQSEFSGNDKIKYTCSVVISYINLSLSMVMALCADMLYKKKIKKDIGNIKKQHNSEAEYKAALKSKGGISVPGTVVAVLATLVISLTNFIPAILAFLNIL